jgi:hypothetical protein
MNTSTSAWVWALRVQRGMDSRWRFNEASRDRLACLSFSRSAFPPLDFR